MFQRIVIAFDGSDQAGSAFRHALAIAARFGAELLVVSVAEPPEPATRVELSASIDAARERFEAAFERLRAAAAAEGVPIRTEVDVGHPAEQIVLAAERERADVIVMGRRGLSTIERWVLGSVSDRVVQHAHCPVLVVR
jgi:nucleotide-binding universal stress UspA family protein